MGAKVGRRVGAGDRVLLWIADEPEPPPKTLPTWSTVPLSPGTQLHGRRAPPTWYLNAPSRDPGRRARRERALRQAVRRGSAESLPCAAETGNCERS